MTYALISNDSLEIEVTPLFIEGAVLAANFTTDPLPPETWLQHVIPQADVTATRVIQDHLQQQYLTMKQNAYSLLDLLSHEHDDALAELAEGFMSVWPHIEPKWHRHTMSDGAVRMLQALLTTMMLAIDEAETQASMLAAGIESPPCLQDLRPQLDIMIQEVALAADEKLLGAQAHSINPYKDVGRNDPCPCGSGLKFKQCCRGNGSIPT
ncbi:MAG: YecA family protein [Vibrio sp.]